MFVTTTAGQILALDPATGKSLWTFKPETPFGGKPRHRNRRRAAVRRTARLDGDRRQPADGRSRLAASSARRAFRAQGISTAPGLRQRRRRGGRVGRRQLRARPGVRAGREDRLAPLEFRSGARSRRNQVTRPGPQDSDIWKYGGGAIWTIAVGGRRSRARLPRNRATRCRSGAASCGRATISSTTPWSRSISSRARCAGTTSSCTTTSGNTTWARRSCSTTRQSAGGRARCCWRCAPTACRSSWIARPACRCSRSKSAPVKQDAFLKTSPTQPFTVGADRVGPACVDKNMIPPGFEAGCYFDPIRVDMPNHYMPHMNMRQTPMAYSPATGYLYASVCVNPAWIRRAETPWAFVRPTRAAGTAAARVHDGHRRAHRQDGLAEARRVRGLRGRRRRDRDGRRPGVPRRTRRQFPGLLREDRRRACGSSRRETSGSAAAQAPAAGRP